ncbi:MAG: murein transglycosylase domain-containing protein [Wolinella sp.]
MRFVFPALILLFLLGCSLSDYQSIARAALSKDPSAAASALARQKSLQYAKNPKALARDLENIKIDFDKIRALFLGEVSKKWGKEETRSASQKIYVKYTDHYKSRAEVDFEKGEIVVETIDLENPTQSLKKAIITTLLTPQDPEGVDLYSDKEIKFEGAPYLAGLVKDHEEKVILYEWRASRYADYLLKNSLKERTAKGGQRVYYVMIPMTRDYVKVRSAKYGDIVKKYAKLHHLNEALVLAIIQSESSFNPYAVSQAPAYGLMQIVPQSAGRDAHKEIHGVDGFPTRSMLFDPETNIRYGTTYLRILFTRYLEGVKHPQSLEYCVISAYNTGSGNVLRTFDSNRTKALGKINAQTPQEVYRKLRISLPYEETRNYLKKVTEAKRSFIVYEKP